MNSQAPKATTIMLSARAGRGPIHRPSNAVTPIYGPQPSASGDDEHENKRCSERKEHERRALPWHAHQVPQLPLPPLSQCDPYHERDRRDERECPPRFPARLPRLTVGELAPHPC